ncbi:MAG: metal-binding protein ZinT [Chloroflexaceae bacterium]|nr:metal-binding protein ZinT [Chloroflexaceae bacterium]
MLNLSAIIKAMLALVPLATGVLLIGQTDIYGGVPTVPITTNDLVVESAAGSTTYRYDTMDFEGGKCLCQRIAFRSAQAFLAATGATAINSDTLTVVTRWNTHGAEELLVHEFGWPEDRVIYPPDLTDEAYLTLADAAYYFIPAEGDTAWKVQATVNVFPEGFFEKRTAVQTAPTAEAKQKAQQAFLPLKTQAISNLTALPLTDMFTVEEVERSGLLFAGWNGQWVSTHTFLDDAAMQSAYAAVADATPLHTAESVQIFLETMYQADFTALDISGQVISYTLSPTQTVACPYEERGMTPLYWGGVPAGWWYQYQTDAPACEPFKYLVMTTVHAHEDSTPHWHLRYGSSSFDTLLNDAHYAMWWPTAMPAGTAVEALVEETKEEAALYVSMLPNWDGQWVSTHTFLDDAAMQAAYETIASLTSLHTAESVEDFVKAMYRSDFTAMDISSQVISYTLSPTQTIACPYEERGIAAAGGTHGGWWYLYHTDDAACTQFAHLIVTRVHGHGGIPHWHLRYGNTSFDDLVSNPAYARWGATAVAQGTTAAQFAQDAVDEADIYAMMLPPPLAQWAGTGGGKWVSASTFLEDVAMQGAYAAIAEAAGSAYVADDVHQAMVAMYATVFGAMEIGDSTITFVPEAANASQLVASVTCAYQSVGEATATWGEHAFVWHRLETTSTDDACAPYTYLVATDVHSHGEGTTHWHLRYGSTSFDDLMTNSTYTMWWPTLVAEETTAQQFADEMEEEQAEMAVMLQAMLPKPEPTEGQKVVYLPLVTR